MPKVMHVAKARQRYEMVPVLGEDGKQETITQNLKRPTRRGKTEITRAKTKPDMSRPLPPRECDYSACPQPDKIIAIGTPFKYISIRRTYGDTTRYRHESCPSWHPWEYSSALWARVAQIQHENAVDGSGWESEEDADSARDDVAAAVGELRDEKQEALDNMPDGLRDASELNDTVSYLDDWVSEIESVIWPDFPEGQCENCKGEQLTHDEHTDECDEDCDGTEECLECNGSNEGGEPDPDELQDWRDEAQQTLQDALDGYQG